MSRKVTDDLKVLVLVKEKDRYQTVLLALSLSLHSSMDAWSLWANTGVRYEL